jgi:hypothetical protein
LAPLFFLINPDIFRGIVKNTRFPISVSVGQNFLCTPQKWNAEKTHIVGAEEGGEFKVVNAVNSGGLFLNGRFGEDMIIPILLCICEDHDATVERSSKAKKINLDRIVHSDVIRSVVVTMNIAISCGYL